MLDECESSHKEEGGFTMLVVVYVLSFVVVIKCCIFRIVPNKHAAFRLFRMLVWRSGCSQCPLGVSIVPNAHVAFRLLRAVHGGISGLVVGEL